MGLARGQFLFQKLRYTFTSVIVKDGVRCMSSSASSSSSSSQSPADSGKSKKISLAMRAYLEKARSHDEYMASNVAEFEIGKRHLASIMSIDPDSITQEDINKAIEYLLPSGVFDKKARPMLKHPEEVLPRTKTAQFGMDGRPFHHLFYTGYPAFYNLMQEMGEKLDMLKKHEDQMTARNVKPDAESKLMLAGSVWTAKIKLQKMIKEEITQFQYDQFTRLMERLASQAFAHDLRDEIFKYRTNLQTSDTFTDVLPLLYTETGRPYMKADGKRKSAQASVTVWGKGSGRFSVNNTDILTHFPCVLDREQLMFPLQFCEVLGEVDVEASAEGGGAAGQAGAIRLATARALTSFMDRDTMEKMRLAGLLTLDPRRKERKKYGQMRARRKYTWRKR